MSDPTLQPQDPAEAPERAFRDNLEAFGERAARLSRLAKAGRLEPESCFVALSQLWMQLARARRRVAAPGSPHHDVRISDEPGPSL